MENGAAMKGRVARTLGAACLVTFLTVPAAWASIQPTPFRTSLFGVTVEQAIRISVLNAADIRGIIEPCARVVDAAGNLLVKMDAGPVPAGAGAFFDFDPLPPGPASVPGDRAPVRVEVEIVPAAFPPNPRWTPPAPRVAFHLTREFSTLLGQADRLHDVIRRRFWLNPQPVATVADTQADAHPKRARRAHNVQDGPVRPGRGTVDPRHVLMPATQTGPSTPVFLFLISTARCCSKWKPARCRLAPAGSWTSIRCRRGRHARPGTARRFVWRSNSSRRRFHRIRSRRRAPAAATSISRSKCSIPPPGRRSTPCPSRLWPSTPSRSRQSRFIDVKRSWPQIGSPQRVFSPTRWGW